VQGHLAYFAVPGNTDAVATFRTQIGRHWYKALRRRSQRTRLNWTRMDPSQNDGYHRPVPGIPSPACASTPEPEAGAQCGNPARWDLCGGPSARAVPTAILSGAPTQICRTSQIANGDGLVNNPSSILAVSNGVTSRTCVGRRSRAGGRGAGIIRPWCDDLVPAFPAGASGRASRAGDSRRAGSSQG
jgi:hypothetical protein